MTQGTNLLRDSFEESHIAQVDPQVLERTENNYLKVQDSRGNDGKKRWKIKNYEEVSEVIKKKGSSGNSIT